MASAIVARIIVRELEARLWTPLEVVERGHLDPIEFGALLAGEQRMTPELADGLARAFGTSVEFWSRLGAAG